MTSLFQSRSTTTVKHLTKSSSIKEIERVILNGINELELFHIFFEECGMNGLLTEDGMWYKVSQYFANRLGYEKEKMQGMYFSDFVYKPDLARTIKAYRLFVENNGKFPAFQNRLQTKSGELILVQWDSIGRTIQTTENRPRLFVTKAVEIDGEFCDREFCHFKRLQDD